MLLTGWQTLGPSPERDLSWTFRRVKQWYLSPPISSCSAPEIFHLRRYDLLLTCVFKCISRSRWYVKVLLHVVQLSFSLVSLAATRLMVWFLLHVLHLHRVSPTCVDKCIARSLPHEKALSHNAQRYGLFPRCNFTWADRQLLDLKAFPHVVQW